MTNATIRIKTRIRGLLKPSSFFMRPESFNLLNDDETLSLLSESRLGIVRLGNSELAFLSGHHIRTQKQLPRYRKKIEDIFDNYHEQGPSASGFVLGLPLDLALFKNMYVRPTNTQYFTGTVAWALRSRVKFGATYGSSHLFRVLEVRSSGTIEKHIQKVDNLFRVGNVIVVGPTHGRNGIQHCPPVVRYDDHIAIPETNALDRYDYVLDETLSVCSLFKSPLVVVVGGLFGTILSADLNAVGVRTVDLGQFCRHRKEFYKSMGGSNSG